MKFWLLLFSLFFVAACGPIYETKYQIVPPPTNNGRMCANNCLMMKQNCSQYCDIKAEQCEISSRLEARSDYLDYVLERQKSGKPIKKTEDSFNNSYKCTDSSCEDDCTGNYHICHTNCGGQVIPMTVCTYNCNAQ